MIGEDEEEDVSSSSLNAAGFNYETQHKIFESTMDALLQTQSLQQSSLSSLLAKRKKTDALPQEYISKLPRMRMGCSKKDCTICTNHFEQNEVVRVLPCKHVFHDQCLMPWFQTGTSCPNCRFDVLNYYEKSNAKPQTIPSSTVKKR